MTDTSPLATAAKGRLQRNPLDLLEHDHICQARLCDILESIADSLPEDIDRRACRQAAMALRFELPLHHLDEEEGLFPLLLRYEGQTEKLAAITTRLAREHKADESFAEELTEALETLSETGRTRNPEALGYMLRGFFESYRRHIHWENEVLMPLARKLLNEKDLNELSACMARNRSI